MDALLSWSTGTTITTVILALLIYDLTQRYLQWQRLRHISRPCVGRLYRSMDNQDPVERPLGGGAPECIL